MTGVRTEQELAHYAHALIGKSIRLTRSERALLRCSIAIDADITSRLRREIESGGDPLGVIFCQLRSSETRREQGAVYTPEPIINRMFDWAAGEDEPERIVDPGAGSGRFILEAAERFPAADLIAVELDPLASLLLRANAAVRRIDHRLTIMVDDYRAISLPKIAGHTLFIGNPPYVRHHDIGQDWKDWMASTAKAFGFKASKLAGLHIHFFLKTRQLARLGDYGAFITSAEWLDVNYGDVLRKLLTNGLGGASVDVIAPQAMPFADTATTGAITTFRVGQKGRGIAFSSVDSVDELDEPKAERIVSWSRLDRSSRWSPLLAPMKRRPRDTIELGDLCRVHRGQVTGNNAVWIAGGYPGPLPKSVLVPTVTKARDLISAGDVLSDPQRLRCTINLPIDLDGFTTSERRQINRFLRWATEQGADQSYVAQNRRAWWAINLKQPAPILCTYMARRAPVFVRNLCGAGHLNIAHGLYPHESLPDLVLMALVEWLNSTACTSAGRTYAGGLTKFEPKELERLPIPPLNRLYERAEKLDTRPADRRRGGRKSDLPAATS